jgi:glutathione S-transferase
MQRVPTILIDGLKFTESMAICEYLDETRDLKPHFLPKNDPAKRAHIRMLCEIINSGVQPF